MNPQPPTYPLPGQRVALVAAAFLGLTAVALGAMGAHSLEGRLTPNQLASFRTGTDYQMYHALYLLVLSLLPPGLRFRGLGLTIGLAIAGVLCFSGSIYLLTTADAKGLWWVTPLGGTMLMLSWLTLLVGSIFHFARPHKPNPLN